MRKGSSTSWTISLEDARPRFLNEESIEKESVQKIQKYDKKKSRKKETSQKVKSIQKLWKVFKKQTTWKCEKYHKK